MPRSSVINSATQPAHTEPTLVHTLSRATSTEIKVALYRNGWSIHSILNEYTKSCIGIIAIPK